MYLTTFILFAPKAYNLYNEIDASKLSLKMYLTTFILFAPKAYNLYNEIDASKLSLKDVKKRVFGMVKTEISATVGKGGEAQSLKFLKHERKLCDANSIASSA